MPIRKHSNLKFPHYEIVFFDSLFCAILLVACDHREDITIVVPDTEISSTLLDSMIVSDELPSTPDFYDKYDKKTYRLTSSGPKVSGHFQISGQDIVLTFNDSTVVPFGSTLLIKIADKNLKTINGTYTNSDNNIYYEWWQYLGIGKARFIADFVVISTGTVQFEYEPQTNSLSGTISLQYPFGIYVPYYFSNSNTTPPQTDQEILWLQSGGSFRRQEITFKHLKELK